MRSLVADDVEGEAEGTVLTTVDSRDHLNVVFIGHVGTVTASARMAQRTGCSFACRSHDSLPLVCNADAGKSTLAGSILFLTGNVDKRTIEKFEREAKDRNRESWYLAYIMDTNEEERAKGKTVEVGRATFETTNKR